MVGRAILIHPAWLVAAAIFLGGSSRAEAQSTTGVWKSTGSSSGNSLPGSGSGFGNSGNGFGNSGSGFGSGNGTGGGPGSLSSIFSGILTPEEEMMVMMTAMAQTEAIIESEGMYDIDSWDLLFIFLSYYVEDYLAAVDGALGGNGNGSGTGGTDTGPMPLDGIGALGNGQGTGLGSTSPGIGTGSSGTGSSGTGKSGAGKP